MADFETYLITWRDAERRLDERPPRERALLERIADRILAELRRRLGGPYTTQEVADLYARGTDWCTQLAVEVAPDEPWAWDPRLNADAAECIGEVQAGGDAVGDTPRLPGAENTERSIARAIPFQRAVVVAAAVVVDSG